MGDDRAGARRLAALAAPFVLLLAGGCGGGSHPPDLDAAVERVVSTGVPGTPVLVRDGDRTRTAAAGLADIGARRKLRPEDRFRVGSVTKTFVATVCGSTTLWGAGSPAFSPTDGGSRFATCSRTAPA